MIYGLYLSASGVMTNSYRQDVIANNLANSETVGFKRDLRFFRNVTPRVQDRNKPGDWSDPTLEKLGGGILATPTLVDTHQGDLEHTGNPLDVGIEGEGYFAVTNGREKHLTRDGRFMVNRNGDLILSTAQGQRILDEGGKPIHLEPTGPISILNTGVISQNGKPVAKLGLFDVEDHSKFTKQGGTMIAYPDPAQLRPATGIVHAEFQERAQCRSHH